MGLLYLFPENKNDEQFAKVTPNGLTLATYGLPGIFWFYLLATMITLLILSLAIWSPLKKVLTGEDIINYYLGVAAIILIIMIPLVSILFFFYQKSITKKDQTLKIEHKFFGIKIFSSTIKLRKEDPFVIEHQLDSPNLAKIKNDPALRGFQNKGHFYLKAYDQRGALRYVDRHSRKIDLVKLKELLSAY